MKRQLNIDHTYAGRALLHLGDRMIVPASVSVDLASTWGFIQAGIADKWIPEKHLEVGQSYKFSVGEYEFSVTRKPATNSNMSKIIKMDWYR